MSKLLLICKNRSTALESVSAILRYTPDDLIKSLTQLNITAQDSNIDIELNIKNRFLNTGNFLGVISNGILMSEGSVFLQLLPE